MLLIFKLISILFLSKLSLFFKTGVVDNRKLKLFKGVEIIFDEEEIFGVFLMFRVFELFKIFGEIEEERFLIFRFGVFILFGVFLFNKESTFFRLIFELLLFLNLLLNLFFLL